MLKKVQVYWSFGIVILGLFSSCVTSYKFYQRIISNDSYAHDEQGVNRGQVRGFDGVLYKL